VTTVFQNDDPEIRGVVLAALRSLRGEHVESGRRYHPSDTPKHQRLADYHDTLANHWQRLIAAVETGLLEALIVAEADEALQDRLIAEAEERADGEIAAERYYEQDGAHLLAEGLYEDEDEDDTDTGYTDAQLFAHTACRVDEDGAL
jgi:hypothetical protein